MERVVRIFFACVLAASGAEAWTCPDDGSTRILINNQVAGDYRVIWEAGDHSVLVKVLDANGEVIDSEPLPIDDDGVTVGVPLGGSILIEDPADANTQGATGSLVQPF